jgi:hypothetical protein
VLLYKQSQEQFRDALSAAFLEYLDIRRLPPLESWLTTEKLLREDLLRLAEFVASSITNPIRESDPLLHDEIVSQFVEQFLVDLRQSGIPGGGNSDYGNERDTLALLNLALRSSS